MLGGIAVGPSGLGWLQPNPAIDLFEKIGLGLIFALIGLTIDQKTLGDTAGRLGFLGWLATLAIGTLLATLLPLGDGLRPLALVVALSSTAFSTLFVILKDSGEWEAPLGRLLRSAGTWGQLGPVLAVALLLGSADPRATALSVGLVVLVAWLLATVPGQISGHRAWAWLRKVVAATPATPLQLLYLLIVGLIALSSVLGVNILMGAILAGLVMRRFIVDPQTSASLKHLEVSAQGLFIPLFFVEAGSRLDLASVVAHPWGPLLCLMGIVVIRGLPQFLLYCRALPDRRERLIDAFLADPRWADHWTGYWQDVLAENPNLLNPTLNNSGPFRFFIHEAFLDRIYIVKVPYCLRVSEEVRIYDKLLESSSLSKAPCAPGTLKMMAQFAILTRLKEPENSSLFSKMRVYDG